MCKDDDGIHIRLLQRDLLQDSFSWSQVQIGSDLYIACVNRTSGPCPGFQGATGGRHEDAGAGSGAERAQMVTRRYRITHTTLGERPVRIGHAGRIGRLGVAPHH